MSSFVNCVRFSPNGKYLAASSDSLDVYIFSIQKRPGTLENNEPSSSWHLYKTLRAHISEVIDLKWSADSNFLITASMDQTAVLWNVEKGQKI